MAVLILAHRGLPGPDRPENTLAAVRAALDAGADGVEVDLRLTQDGVLALSHDPDLDRLCGTGTVIADTAWPVLRERARGAGLELTRVEELLPLVAGHPVVLELKTPPPADLERTAQTVIAAVRAAREAGTPTDVRISSFAPDLLLRVRELLRPADGVTTALLGPPGESPRSLIGRALSDAHPQVHPYVEDLVAEPDAVAAAQAQGLSMIPWTVNAPEHVRVLAREDVAGIITDDPAGARLAAARA